MGDNDKVVEFNPDALKERVVDTVRSTFGQLIPDDQWVKMVDKEVKSFFEDDHDIDFRKEPVKDGYGNIKEYDHVARMKMTPFRMMVWEALQDLIGDKLRAQLSSSEFTTYADRVEGDYQLGPLLLVKLGEVAPQMAVAIFKEMFGTMAENIKHSALMEMQNSNNRY